MTMKHALRDSIRSLMRTRIVDGKPLTTNKLSRLSGVPQSTLSRILSGADVDVRLNNLEKLADYFGVAISDLRGGIGAQPLSLAAGRLADVAAKNSGAGERHLTYVTLQEMELLMTYRSSNPIGRRSIFATAAVLSKQEPLAAPNVVRSKKKR